MKSGIVQRVHIENGMNKIMIFRRNSAIANLGDVAVRLFQEQNHGLRPIEISEPACQ